MRHFVKGFVAVAMVLSVAALAQADGVRDAGNKMRGDYEHVFGQNNNNYSYSYAAPRFAAPAQAPAAVAEAPNARRSFSADDGAAQPANANQGCGSAAAAPAAPAPTAQAPTAQGPTTAARRFSYEPTTTTYSAAPVYRTSPTPQYLMPKSDPNKFRVW